MGTSGGGAGGGSGGFGGGSSAGRGARGGILRVSHGTVKAVDPSVKTAWNAFQGVFSRLSNDYLSTMIGDAGVVAAYEALHRLDVLLSEKSWGRVEAQFGVGGLRHPLI